MTVGDVYLCRNTTFARPMTWHIYTFHSSLDSAWAVSWEVLCACQDILSLPFLVVFFACLNFIWIRVFVVCIFLGPLNDSTNHSIHSKYFCFSLHFVILNRHNSLFYILIRLQSAFRDDKTKNINSFSQWMQRAMSLDWMICGVNVKPPIFSTIYFIIILLII